MAMMWASEPFITSRSRVPKRLFSRSAETWWNSSMASTVPSKSEGVSLSKAKRSVAWVHTSTASLLCMKRMNCATLLSLLPGRHRLLRGSTSQSAKNPFSTSLVGAKEPPIERSGTATMTFLRPWLKSLSRATNISARDLPDAGGALIRRYSASRFS